MLHEQVAAAIGGGDGEEIACSGDVRATIPHRGSIAGVLRFGAGFGCTQALGFTGVHPNLRLLHRFSGLLRARHPVSGRPLDHALCHSVSPTPRQDRANEYRCTTVTGAFCLWTRTCPLRRQGGLEAPSGHFRCNSFWALLRTSRRGLSSVTFSASLIAVLIASSKARQAPLGRPLTACKRATDA